MTNPILVETTRGKTVESVHRGAIAVCDGDGKTVWSCGDIEKPVFPRSAVKAIQALPLIETGAADRYGFGNRELALACASHSSEPTHMATALAMLAKAGLGEEAYECGAHWPFEQPVLIEMARSGRMPTPACNNCSGKHSGFLCTAVHAGDEIRGYINPDHAVQVRVRGVLEALTSANHSMANAGRDGCSIPTYAIPVKNMAHAFARMTTGVGLEPLRSKAAALLIAACMAEPFHVAGTGRACTKLMEAAPGEIFAKTGAEGVYCGALPKLGLGFALKCEDGTTRAAEAMAAALIARLLGMEHPANAVLSAMANGRLTNWFGTEVGRVRAVLPA
jgi:L-asparaginase II